MRQKGKFHEKTREDIGYGIFYGMIVMFFYNLLLYLSLKSIISYILTIVCTSVFFCIASGLLEVSGPKTRIWISMQAECLWGADHLPGRFYDAFLQVKILEVMNTRWSRSSTGDHNKHTCGRNLIPSAGITWSPWQLYSTWPRVCLQAKR
jgi:hypothetical protein